MSTGRLRCITLKLAPAEHIRKASSGEVTVDAAFDESGAPVPGGIFCPAIFGTDGTRRGHIELAWPVVHPWYEEIVRAIAGMDDLDDGGAALDALRALDADKLSPSDPATLRMVKAMGRSGTPLEALVIQALPVVPPAIRPEVRVSGAALSSDLNEMYLRVISRNNSLRDLLAEAKGQELGAYAKDARDRLTSAVRSLIGPGGEGPLQSLTDLLVAPNGFLKRNLEGKRVDYSGRSVIVSGPELNLDQCGLPYEMALEQFKPFIARKLVESSAARGVLEAVEMIHSEPHNPKVRRAAEQVAAEKLVLLNRAPTLSRLAIQPFRPVLTDDRAIALHPLACYGFNADFDGDQMAVHVPISAGAQDEQRSLLDSAISLVSSSDGNPAAAPVQDMVLGLWYLTRRGQGKPIACKSAEELIEQVKAGEIAADSAVTLADHGFASAKSIETTAGRVLFNAQLPRELRFMNSQVGRDQLSEIVKSCLELCGSRRARQMLDDLDRLGFEFATRYAPSYGLGCVPSDDAITPIREQALHKEKELRRAGLDPAAYRQQSIDLWLDAAVKSQEALRSVMTAADPLHAVVESGSRGNWRVIARSFGIEGPVAGILSQSKGILSQSKGGGSALEAGVPSSYWSGFGALEHFALSFGSRKGLLDAGLRTTDAGYMMRKLIYGTQDILITSEDCGSKDGLAVGPLVFGGSVLASLADRVRGRVAAEHVKAASGEVIAKAGELISREQASEIEASGIQSVRIRSVLTCEEKNGVCAKCYGADPAAGTMVETGSAVGVIAAQAVSEPATQLTMRAYHGPVPGPMPGSPGHPGGLNEMVDIFAGLSADPAPAQLVDRLQSIFRFQGVAVNDKHFEIIARKMYSFARIDDPGDTLLLAGEVVANDALESENAKVASGGGKPAKGSPAVLGIEESARSSSSVIRSAACGDTRQVLALAALAGATDPLSAALERIVAGLAPDLPT